MLANKFLDIDIFSLYMSNKKEPLRNKTGITTPQEFL